MNWLCGAAIRNLQFAQTISNVAIFNGHIRNSNGRHAISSQGDHDYLTTAIIANASDFVSGPRPEEGDLSGQHVRKKQFDRLAELVKKLDEMASPVDVQLFVDIVIRCATDMGILSSKSDLTRLPDLLWKHKNEPINRWLDKRHGRACPGHP